MKQLKLQQKRVNEKKLSEMLSKRMQTDNKQSDNAKTRDEFFKQLRMTNSNMGREISDLKVAISDVLNENNYDKHKKKYFLKTMTKQN